MRYKNYLAKYKNQVTQLKINTLYVEKLLNEYVAEDKVYLFVANKRLKEKVKNLEAMLEQLNSCNKEIQRGLQKSTAKYFEKLREEFRDFLIILRWSDFSSLHMNLQIICEEKSPIPFSERKNYKKLLNLLDETHSRFVKSNPNSYN